MSSRAAAGGADIRPTDTSSVSSRRDSDEGHEEAMGCKWSCQIAQLRASLAATQARAAFSTDSAM